MMHKSVKMYLKGFVFLGSFSFTVRWNILVIFQMSLNSSLICWLQTSRNVEHEHKTNTDKPEDECKAFSLKARKY